jgi:Fucose permease
MATGTSPSAAPAARMDPHTARRGMFVLKDGRNVLFTFLLLIFLFALWGFCNGMIDVMDKHFQEVLHLSLSQSAWVQFAHYLGYFLMAMPAGWLATKLGYKGGIIIGLLMTAVGGFWFIPATHISQFWAFSDGRLHHRGWAYVSGNDRKSIYDGVGPTAVRRDAHQPCAVNQRHRPALRTDRGRGILLFEERSRFEHRQRTALDSVRVHRRDRDHSSDRFLLRAHARHRDGGRLPPR